MKCKCGCGEIIPKNSSYKLGHNMRGVCGDKHPLWKGGISRTYLKYREIDGRTVAEKIFGKSLPTTAVVHHVDNDTHNNIPSNLVICENNGYHLSLHKRTRAYKACGEATWRKCWICKEYDAPENLYITKRENSAHHRSCMKIHRKRRR